MKYVGLNSIILHYGPINFQNKSWYIYIYQGGNVDLGVLIFLTSQ